MREVEGQSLVNLRGDKVGTIREVVCEAPNRDSQWACVKYGPLHLRCAYVPLRDAVEEDGRVRIPYETEVIHDAPEVELDDQGRIGGDDAAELHRHFGLEPLESPARDLDDDDLDLPRKPREAMPPAMEEGPDSPLSKRRRERARELGVPEQD
jgi:hypothetical protein